MLITDDFIVIGGQHFVRAQVSVIWCGCLEIAVSLSAKTLHSKQAEPQHTTSKVDVARIAMQLHER